MATKPLMSDAELRRRKKLQGQISRTTSTLGLAGVGMLGTGLALKKKPTMLRAIPKYKHLSQSTIKAKGQKLSDTATYTGIVSGGVGGVGGYNFAAYTNAESRKRKQGMSTVRKNDELCPVVGDEGIAKKWEPVATKYDPESRRQRRNEFYPTAAAGAGGAGSAALGVSAVDRHLKSKKQYKAAEGLQDQGVKIGRAKKKGTAAEARNLLGRSRNLTDAARLSSKGAKLRAVGAVGALGAGVAASEHLRRKATSRDWATYSKSAFGVNHD